MVSPTRRRLPKKYFPIHYRQTGTVVFCDRLHVNPSAFGSVGSPNTNGAEQGIFTDQIKNHENSLNLALPQEENSFDILAKSDEKKKKDAMNDKTEGKMEGKDKEPDSGHEDIEKKEETPEGHSKE